MREGLLKKIGLDARELDEIRELAGIVETFDGIKLKLNWEMLKSRPPGQINDFLYYKDGKLAAFLGIYIIIPGESELSGMVHPDYRRQGFASAMVEEALDLLRRRGTKTVIFMCPRASETGAAFLKQRGLPYSFSEYVMENKDGETEQAQAAPALRNAEIRLREADFPGDVKLLAELNQVGFDMKAEAAEEMARGTIGPSEMTYIVESEGRAVGKVGVQLEKDAAFIFGFCVRPESRGRGIGRAALAETIGLLRRERGCRHFMLEVTVGNEGALGLYESTGFRRINTIDYYKAPLSAD